MPRLSDRDARFIDQLFEQTETTEQWRSLVAFGLRELLDNQVLLVAIICREAKRRAENSACATSADEVLPRILNELGLRLSLVPPLPPGPDHRPTEPKV